MLAISGASGSGTFANACLASGSPHAVADGQFLKITYQITGGLLTTANIP